MNSVVDMAPGNVVPDHVVLLDGQGQPTGTADRDTVHSDRTPRHLAFSVWIFGPDGSILITRRALGKRSWPGVWTNSCCGHPRPSEQQEDAVRRRVREELGVELVDLVCVLPGFSYRAVDGCGMVENELCPVFLASKADTHLHPDPGEVAEWSWQSPDQLRVAMSAAPYAFSPWSRKQLGLIPDLTPPERSGRC